MTHSKPQSSKTIFAQSRKAAFAALLACALPCPAAPASLQACTAPGFMDRVKAVAEANGVDYYELLSIVAHESRCQPYTIAWVVPGKLETAQSRVFPDAATAAAFATQLIQTGKYRVDVGIGQINNEAHIRPKGWTLTEVLDPQRGLERTAQVLRERGWSGYHSNESGNAVIWQGAALKTLRHFYPKATLRRPNEQASLVDRGGGSAGAVVPPAPAFVITPETVLAANKPATPPTPPTAPATPPIDPNQPVSLTPSSEADKSAAPDTPADAAQAEAAPPAAAPAPTPVFAAQSWLYQAESEEGGELDEEQPIIVFGGTPATVR
ncbi:MAG: hypothetical protein IK051_05920 [Rhodocyclaceae bacterium]|nr:hypothetical protein [Rhodocyclaceae bacterium]